MISALDFEHAYVHTAYELLARLLETGIPRTWPFVNEFLNEFQTGSIIGDIGCGEGKYLQQETQSWMVGTDRSLSLSEIANSSGNEIATCDITKMPFRSQTFDGLICISVIHHLATETRRVKALKELGRLLRPGGKVLITAWALENEYRKFICQDVLVPAEVSKDNEENYLQQDTLSNSAFLSMDFVKQQATRLTAKIGGIRQMLSKEVEALKSKLRTASNVTDTIHTYITNRKRSIWLWVEDRTLLNKLGHIFRGSLRRTCSTNDIEAIQQHPYGHDTQQRARFSDRAAKVANGFRDDLSISLTNNGIHRYYHVFQKGELTRLVKENVPTLEVIEECFEQGNWVVVAQKSSRK